MGAPEGKIFSRIFQRQIYFLSRYRRDRNIFIRGLISVRRVLKNVLPPLKFSAPKGQNRKEEGAIKHYNSLPFMRANLIKNNRGHRRHYMEVISVHNFDDFLYVNISLNILIFI